MTIYIILYNIFMHRFRELARLGSTMPVGAAQLYDGKPRMPLPPATVPAPGFDKSGIDFGEEKPLFKSKLYANTKK